MASGLRGLIRCIGSHRGVRQPGVHHTGVRSGQPGLGPMDTFILAEVSWGKWLAVAGELAIRRDGVACVSRDPLGPQAGLEHPRC